VQVRKSEIPEVIRYLEGKKFRCLNCGAELDVNVNLKSYLHEKPDKYWLYLECHNCGYGNSLSKLLRCQVKW